MRTHGIRKGADNPPEQSSSGAQSNGSENLGQCDGNGGGGGGGRESGGLSGSGAGGGDDGDPPQRPNSTEGDPENEPEEEKEEKEENSSEDELDSEQEGKLKNRDVGRGNESTAADVRQKRGESDRERLPEEPQNASNPPLQQESHVGTGPFSVVTGKSSKSVEKHAAVSHYVVNIPRFQHNNLVGFDNPFIKIFNQNVSPPLSPSSSPPPSPSPSPSSLPSPSPHPSPSLSPSLLPSPSPHPSLSPSSLSSPSPHPPPSLSPSPLLSPSPSPSPSLSLPITTVAIETESQMAEENELVVGNPITMPQPEPIAAAMSSLEASTPNGSDALHNLSLHPQTPLSEHNQQLVPFLAPASFSDPPFDLTSSDFDSDDMG